MNSPEDRGVPAARCAAFSSMAGRHAASLRAIGSAAVVLAVASLAAWLRFARLDNRPMHCDEANQAIKFGQLLEDRHYVYDPREHHGPSLNYLTLPVVRLRGLRHLAELSEQDLRQVPALFGIALVGLVCLLRRELGHLATAVAAGLTALSPAMVFYSRYYIHEMLLVVFTFGALAALCGFARVLAACAGRSAGCRGLRWWLCCGPWVAGFGLTVAMMHASKETCAIALAAMLLAAGLLFYRPRSEAPKLPAAPGGGTPALPGRVADQPPAGNLSRSAWTLGNGQCRRVLLAVALALAVAAGLSALLFSSFGRNLRGVRDSYTTYFYYLGRASGEGTTGRHVQRWDYYFRTLFGPQRGNAAWWPDGEQAPEWLSAWPFAARLATAPLYWPELPIAILALLGLLAVVWGRGMPADGLPLARFLAAYTLLMIGVYSAVPYKTPWCALSFLHGMILLAGIGTGAVWAGFARPGADPAEAEPQTGAAKPLRSRWRRWTCQLSAVVLLAGSSCWLGWQTWLTSFRDCEDPANPFVYSHTTSEVLDLVQRVEQIVQAQPEGRRTYIQVICAEHDYWPLPWYLRKFERVAWLDRVPHGRPAVLIITQPELERALAEYLYERQPPGQRRLYLRVLRDEGSGWQLRPHVPLEIFVRLDARDRYLRHWERRAADPIR